MTPPIVQQPQTIILQESVAPAQHANDAVRLFKLTPAAPLPLRNTRQPLQFFVLSDIAALMLGAALSWAATLLANKMLLGRDAAALFAGDQIVHLWHFSVIGVVLLLWLNQRGHYRTRLPFWMEIQNVVAGAGLCILLDSFLQFATKQDLSRLWLVSSWLFAAVAIIGLRAIVRHALRRNGTWEIRTLVIGSGATAHDAKAALASETQLGYRIVGQVRNLAEQLRDAQGSWTRLCNWHNADFVLIALDGVELQSSADLLTNLTRERVPFAISPPLRGVPLLGMEAQYFFNHDVMLLTRCNRLEEAFPRFLKRAFDVVVSGTALLALAPLFITVALMVRRDGGAAFYSDERIGADGRLFGCMKFRSMIVNAKQVLDQYLVGNPEAAEEWRRDQKLRHDPRITKIGTFIRKTSVDELPQLWNVLKGDMSLVGPRPMMANQAEMYGADVTLYQQVRPGITGLWQVSGRNELSFEKRVELDRWYVSNWTLWHDIAILFKTVPVLLFRKGAY